VVREALFHGREGEIPLRSYVTLSHGSEVSYLSKSEQALSRKRLAYNRPEYTEAFAELEQLHRELQERISPRPPG
jgi:hypothetical protein